MFSEHTSLRKGTGAAPGIAGLSAAAATAWLTVPDHVRHSGLSLIWISAAHILITIGVNTLVVQIWGSVSGANIQGVARRSNPIAAWFAPLSAYVAAGSVMALALAAVVGVKTARWIRSAVPHPPDENFTDRIEFGLLPAPSRARVHRLVASALVFEAMIACAAAAEVLWSSVFALAGAVIMGSQLSKHTSQRQPRFSHELISSGLTWILVFLLTARVLGPGGGGGASAGDRTLAATGGGTYWGVFLSLQIPPTPVKPASPVRSSELFDSGVRVRRKIPFDGVYWFFRPPQTRPPEESVTAYGSPDRTRFRSTDSTPILMEAHQTLTDHLDLTGCAAVEVGILNGDSLPGTIGIEVVLRDSSTASDPPLALGIKQAPSLTPERAGLAAHEQTLTFPLPASPQISSFDEITIRYHLDPSRATESAKIAIEYIVLIPTGDRF